MNEEFRKRRLLDAIEYIDDEYIASAARYKMKIKPHSNEPPVQTVGGSLKKYWKQYLGLVACLLLLAMLSPVFSFLAQNIGSLAGSMTGEVPYLQFSPDLEPISERKIEAINEAYIVHYLGITKDELWTQLGENPEERYNTVWRVIRNYDFRSPYYGTFGDCIIFAKYGLPGDGIDCGWWLVDVAGYQFDRHVYAYVNDKVYYLDDAYNQGFLSDDDIASIAKRHEEYLKFREENYDMFGEGGTVPPRVPYLRFSPDLEPISNKKVEDVNRAFLCLYLNTTIEELEQKYGEDYLEDLEYLRVIRNYDWTSPYYGTIDGCVVFSIISYQMGNPSVEIAGYTLNANTFVYSKKNMYRLEQAYLEGVLDDEDIALLAKRHQEFLKFKEENRDMFPQ